MSILKSLSTAGDVTETAAPVRETDSDFEAVRAKIFGSGKGKRKKTTETLTAPETPSDDVKILNELFEKENWEGIASMYFDARFAMTGFEGFLLDEKQKAILGSTMATSMRMLIRLDPKWIALIVFGINYSNIAMRKEIAYRASQGKPKDAVS